MGICLGIDIGSRNTKIVAFNRQNQTILGSTYRDTGSDPATTVSSLLEVFLTSLSLTPDKIRTIFATGYGRHMIKADKAVSEVSCHALGVCHYLPQARTIIDIGGQDCKVIVLDQHGKVADFVMNDKCAAGTGRFLEMVALRLGIDISTLDKLASAATQDLNLSSTCVVFAESEIIGLTTMGIIPADVARAVHLSVASRIIAQVGQLSWQPPLVFTGGVAFNRDLQSIFAQKLATEVLLPPNPELTGALGAALLAAKTDKK